MHQPDAGPGVLTEAVERAGARIAEWFVPEERAPSLAEFAGLVVLGASADAGQEDEHPWLGPEKALIRAALARSLPSLGLCLGAQLIAEAGGGQVRGLAAAEIGWREVELTPEAESDALLAGLANPSTVFQWHHCGFSLPPGGVLLARNETGAQAFRLGRAWGVQFHPEVTGEIVGGWIEADGESAEAKTAGVDPRALSEETAARITAGMELGSGLFERFTIATRRPLGRCG